MKIRSKLIATYTVATITPIIIICIVMAFKTINQSYDGFIENTQKEIHQINNAFNAFFDQVRKNVRFLSEMPAVKNVPLEITNYIGSPKQANARTNSPAEAAIHAAYLTFIQTHNDLLYVYMGG
ncbi:hypothetical protein [Aliikangiella maris]|uniref:Two-component sensor histidine kinase n=2 Tax=Aliikangiella maris TaxID=3162458 RepID=A0ABV2BZA2_9GAMM